MSRTGGAFPFPLPQVAYGGSRVELASGGVFYPPSGTYIYNLDANTILQYFDGQAQAWETLSNASTGGYLSADGFNYRFLNTTGTVTAMAVTAAGSGMTNGIGATATGVAASIAASGTTGGARATAYVIIGGSVQAPTITQAGSGFVVPPLVVIDPPPAGGIQATAIAALSATGTIASITMENVGGGYASVGTPNFWLIPQNGLYAGGMQGNLGPGTSPPPGLVYPTNAVAGNQNTSATGAQLTSAALTGSGTMTGIVSVNSGGGYTAGSPAVTFTGSAGSPTATATVSNTTPAASLVLLQSSVQ